MRCRLCVAGIITIPASQVEFTDNGIKHRSQTNGYPQEGHKNDDEKAAGSVSKCGEGHASQKKLNGPMCRYASACTRSDCLSPIQKSFARAENDRISIEIFIRE